MNGGDEDERAVQRETPTRWQPSLGLALAVGLVAIVLAALVLVRIARPLYSLVFPLEAPLPGAVQEAEHVKPGHGAEYWIYRTDLPGPDVAAFYESEGSTCQYMGPLDNSLDASGGVRSVAHCTGTNKQGGQTVSWEVYIADGHPQDQGPTRFRLYKYGIN